MMNSRKFLLVIVVAVILVPSSGMADNGIETDASDSSVNGSTDDGASPSFRADVMPVFFRAGCNAGTCHGSARGKDGFMLSLFGYDPNGDYERVVNEIPLRRINPSLPDQSLLLLKATGAVPHTGGKLFDRGSDYYKTIHRWIELGACDDEGTVAETIAVEVSGDRLLFDEPRQSQSLKVHAKLSDGTIRDVTELSRFFSNNESVARIDAQGTVASIGPGDTHVFARYNRFTVGVEVIVLPQYPDFSWNAPPVDNFIDQHVFDRLEKLRVLPSELCDDETFLRRVTLDLIARTPTVDEYREFMKDERSDKRSIKIDRLLADEAFADYWAGLWAEQLRLIGGNYAPNATDVKAADTFYQWIRTQMREGRPLNEFVAEMVDSSGSNLTNGPANLYTMLVHKPQFEPKAFAADFSQVFLGIQIQCAECHNHPFDRWTQDDYYSFVSFFTGLKRKPGVEPRERRVYYDAASPPANHVVDGRPMPAKVLGGVSPVVSGGDPRTPLAQWLTSPENELFSRNLANRIWAQLLGRGVIEPVDDIRASNPPVNGPLLNALSERLVESKFDLRTLVRDICNSQVYQLSAKPNESNRRDTRQFSHSHLKRLRADGLIDAVVTATGVPRNFPGFPEGTRAIEYYPRESGDTEGPHFGDVFFATFGRSSRSTVCACETKREPTLSQTLHLSVGETVRDRIAGNREIVKLIESHKSPDEILEQLFVRTLCRRPSDTERESLKSLIADASDPLVAYEDIFWSLLNSTEFIFNH